MSGLFGTFNIAKSGLYAQQEALNVTSHNIANANTDGYTRQKVNLETTTPENSLGAGQIGTGVQVASITRVKDDFLDYQIRTQNGVQGTYTAKDQVLSQVETIINEPSDTGLSTLIGNFYSSFQKLALNPSDPASKQTVAAQSLELTDGLNNTYNQLQQLKTDTNTQINSTVTDVNSILTQLNTVNKAIVQVSVTGQQPNDLLDTRDNLLNQLSSELGINIDKQSNGGVNVSTTNAAGKSITDSATPPNVLNLVQNPGSENSVTLSYVSNIAVENPTSYRAGEINDYTVSYYKKGDTSTGAQTLTVSMTDAEAKQLDENRVLIGSNDGTALNSTNSTTIGSEDVHFSDLRILATPTGALSGYKQAQSDVDTDIGQLNNFAKALAFSVNAVETQSSAYHPDGTSASTTDTVGSYNMFVNSDVTSGYDVNSENAINAGNITLNSAIQNDSSKIITGLTNDSSISGTDDGTRALAIANIQNSSLNIQGITDSTTRQSFVTFTADSAGLKSITDSASGVTTDNYYNSLVDNIGIKEQQAQTMMQNQTTLLASYATSKASVSGVSLDEEMANLVQYQHAYQANAKIISTIDQLLDVVINGLKK